MANKRVRIYTAQDVESHKTVGDCWVSRGGKVYNVSGFLADHPGGDDYILKHGGQDIDAAMKNEKEHDHSESAYDILEEYAIGKLGCGETIVSEDWEATDDFHPEETNLSDDFQKNQFLDLSKPLLKQVWYSTFSKSYYLQQIHQPRHVVNSARLFGPSYLDCFTKTAWYVVPLFWAPITAYIFTRSLVQFTLPGPLPSVFSQPLLPLQLLSIVPYESYLKTLSCFFLGNVIWTLLEYTLHRFLFHVDYYLPDKPAFLTLHFLMHGVHHYLPMDRLRLVMPPPLFIFLETPFTRLAHNVFPAAIANGIISGAFTFYIMYDCMHYALHHTMLPTYLREMKKYHLAHHYKNFELAFGVTSKVWDIVFGTYLQV